LAVSLNFATDKLLASQKPFTLNLGILQSGNIYNLSFATGTYKPLRIFNPASQTQKFDPEGEYIRQWLPELASVDTEYLVTGKIPRLERHRCGYPEPIVDHNQQQKEFKRLYSNQKPKP